MQLFIFISDAWGAVKGGINCFNYDLALACACAKKDDKNIKICCVVPDLDANARREMGNVGIIPITLSGEAFHSPEAAKIISDNIKAHNKLHHYYPDNCNTFCIGHDIYTGSLSKQLAERCDGWNIIFHHMDYESYYLFGNQDVNKYVDKIRKQEDTLHDSDLVCAVGPMLFQSATDILRDAPDIKVIEVYPGLAEFEPLSIPPNRFNPIVFGRVEKNNQTIKQVPLAVDAFARAIAKDKATPVIKNNPKLFVVGYEVGNSIDLRERLEREVRHLQKRATQIAGLACNVVPFPYTTDRKELSKRLCSASVAMMLSLHEGFGLVGYEAIAAGIPLILSENTGLYMFLKREGLEHLVHAVKIEGDVDSETYSEHDLEIVSDELRKIRQEEKDAKKRALELQATLSDKKEKYSWKAVANNFMSNVLGQFDKELKKESTVFYRPEEMKKVSREIQEGAYNDLKVDFALGKHVFMVEGENPLTSLVVGLQKALGDKFSTFIYNMQSTEERKNAYADFMDSCRSFFGRKKDYRGPEFQYALGERLANTILILDNFPNENISAFEDLFSFLDRQSYEFYIFVVFKADSPLRVKPYNKSGKPKCQIAPTEEKAFAADLTYEKKLLIKTLAFRDRMGYSKRLVSYICNGINYHYQSENRPLIFQNIPEIEKELLDIGMMEEYSEFSYQNVEPYLPLAAALNIDDRDYALGITRLGRFYARCYYSCRSRDPQLRWGYFSCKCYSYAAAIDDKMKSEIKNEYEGIILAMRKKAMDSSDYIRYFNILQNYIKEYEAPNDLWIWYILIHCEAICFPSMATLEKLYSILKTEFPDFDIEKRKGSSLYIQLIRMCAELEDELNINDPLHQLLERIDALGEDNPDGTSWAQCFATIVNLAMNQNKLDLANIYLDKFRKITKQNEMYSKMIAIAMETELKIAKYTAGGEAELVAMLTRIKDAYRIACNTLRDYRAQGWILGLWGECRVILNDNHGERNLRESMICRKSSGERTKTYRTWLQRISRYNLQPSTTTLLNDEMNRLGIL